MDTKNAAKRFVLNKKIREYFEKNPTKKNVVIRSNIDEQKVYWKVVREAKDKFAITEVVASKTSFILEGAMQNQQDNRDKKDQDKKIAMNVELDGFEPASETEMPITNASKKRKYHLTRPESRAADENASETVGDVSESVVKEASTDFATISRDFMHAVTQSPDHNTLSNTLKKINAALPNIKDPKERQEVGNMVGALTPMIDKSTAHGSGGLPQMNQNPGMGTTNKDVQSDNKKNKGKKMKESVKKKR